ncbi:MAG: peptidylprolyl isomerase [Gemmataceae bacterium]|nr:peptidylprolyl isomerase [Gemmataceae bacterium]
MLAFLFHAGAAVMRRRFAVLLVGLVVVGLGFAFFRRAGAQPAHSIPSVPPTFTPRPDDYAARVVAYIHKTQPITRQELGEYLIRRMGHAKLPILVNERIIEKECAARGVTVAAAEVDAALEEKMRGVAMDRATFIRTYLAKRQKNVAEFKWDDLRPQLQMARLLADRIEVSPTELRRAFESAHGEKVEGRMILWKAKEEAQALEAYPRLRDSEAAFDHAARNQLNELAGAGGRIKPIARWSADENLEREVFRLQPGQVSQLVKTPSGIVLFKCDKRVPADASASFEGMREKLAAEMREHKAKLEMSKALIALRQEARPQLLLKKADRIVPGPMPAPTEPVAWLWGTEKVTREELGEFLIARYGAEKLEYLVNRKLIDLECGKRGIAISEEQVEEAVKAHLKPLKMDAAVFEKELMQKLGKSLLEWREDVVRPELMLGELARGRATVSDEELQKGFEAHHGERLECRMILWPPSQHGFALSQYTKLRDSEAEFDRAARMQPTPSLATKAGKLEPFGRHCLGDTKLEAEAFKLQPGEVSALIGTEQGDVMIKCDKRIPPDTSVKLESVKAKLMEEILKKKNATEMQLAFKEIRDRAAPSLLLRPAGATQDLVAEAKELLK